MIFSEKVEKISSESDKIKEEIDHNMVVGSAASSNTVLTVTGNASARNSNASARINAAVMHCDIDGEKDANGGVTVAISHIDGRERVLGIGGRERGHGHGQTSSGRVSAGRAANVNITTSSGAGSSSSGSGSGARIARLNIDPDDDDDDHDDDEDDDDDIEGVAITVSSDNGNVVVGGMDTDSINVDHSNMMELEAELAAENDDDDEENSGSSRNSICDAKDFAQTSSSDLMAAALRNDVTAQLAAAGPVGVAAAAAILSAKRYRRSFTFETNPSVRKRQRNRLLRKLKATIDEFTIRVGQQAIILVATPGKPNVCYKVFGAKPLEDVIKNLKSIIMEELDTALAQQAPPTVPEDPTLFELPSLVIDGIPTPVEKMTQAQLRAFIPLMLKYSTGRGKPGWGRESTKPIWWPCEVPWANVRMDARSDEEKQKVPWTHALRQIVLNCYKFHNREDLLPVFNEDEKNVSFKQEIMMMDGQKSILDSIKHENMHSDIYMVEGESNNEDQKLAQQYTPTVIQTIQNPDGTVSIIQVDPNNPIITLPDGTTAQVQGIATIQGDGSEENQIQTMQAINEDGTQSEIVEINTVAEATIQDGQIIITGEDGQPYPVSVNGMIIPMQQQMYQTVLANIQQNNDGTFCVSPIASDGKTDGTIETVSVGNGMSQQIMIQSSGGNNGSGGNGGTTGANSNNDQAQLMQVLQIKSPILQKSGNGGTSGSSGGGGNSGNGGSDNADSRNNTSGHSGDRRKDSILND